MKRRERDRETRERRRARPNAKEGRQPHFNVASCKLVIEVDGGVHANEAQRRYDVLRTESLVQSYGVRVLRVSADHVMTDLDAVLELIRRCCSPA